jgi:hypothetical protein
MSERVTRWFEVEFKIAPDDYGQISLMLDGHEYTFNAALEAVTAFRLGQALVRMARMVGLPNDLVDPEV